jgi:hypothetical protein
MDSPRSIFAIAAGPRAKWVVFLVWLAAIVVAVGPAQLPTKFIDAEDNESTSYLPGDAESTKALSATEDLQGGELASAVIVYRRESGLTAADMEKIQSDVKKLTARRFEGVAAELVAACALGPGQRALDVGAGAARRFAEIGLVDRDDVRQFHDAGLHELQRVAGARLHAQQQRVGYERNVGFRLADADGFDEHAIVDRAHQHHGADRLIGETAEPIARRHRAHIHAAIDRIGRDPGAVAEQRAAGAT